MSVLEALTATGAVAALFALFTLVGHVGAIADELALLRQAIADDLDAARDRAELRRHVDRRR